MLTNGDKYKKEPVPLNITHNGVKYEGLATPLSTSCAEGVCFELDVTLNDDNLGTIYCGNDMHWTMKNMADQELVEKIGQEILLWYE
jgi:hypothetical protein